MSIPKKTLYLHIGLHKTGTSSIQSLLLRNRNQLLKSGLFYPKLDRAIAYHHFIGRYFAPDVMLPWLLEKFDNDLSKLKEAIDLIKSKMLMTSADKIILSTESFIDSDPIKLKNYFSEFNIKIIVFVRRQDIWLESKVNQHFKMNRKDSIKRKRRALLNDRRFDYEKLLKPWEESFGIENIILRAFQKSAFKEETLEECFINLLGIKYDDNWEIRKRSNQKLTRPVIAFIENLDIKINFTNYVYRDFIVYLEQYSKENPDPEIYKYFFSPEERLSLINKYESINDFIGKKYLNLNKGMLFSGPYPKLDDPWEQYTTLKHKDDENIRAFLKNKRFNLKFLSKASKGGNPKMNLFEKLNYLINQKIQKFKNSKSNNPQ